MDRKTVGLLGVVAGLATLSPGLVQTPSAAEALQSSSYADLLTPISNASASLRAHDTEIERARSGNNRCADYRPVYYHRHYHHHHHHHHHHYF